jgi:hypothetical protein
VRRSGRHSRDWATAAGRPHRHHLWLESGGDGEFPRAQIGKHKHVWGSTRAQHDGTRSGTSPPVGDLELHLRVVATEPPPSRRRPEVNVMRFCFKSMDLRSDLRPMEAEAEAGRRQACSTAVVGVREEGREVREEEEGGQGGGEEGSLIPSGVEQARRRRSTGRDGGREEVDEPSAGGDGGAPQEGRRPRGGRTDEGGWNEAK